MRNYDNYSREELNQMMIDEVEQAERQEWLNNYYLKEVKPLSKNNFSYTVAEHGEQNVYKVNVWNDIDINGTREFTLMEDDRLLDQEFLEMEVKELKNILDVIEEKGYGKGNFVELKQRFDENYETRLAEEIQKQKETYRTVNKWVEDHEAKMKEAENILNKHGIRPIKDYYENNIDTIEVENLHKDESKFVIKFNHETKDLEAMEVSTTTNEATEMKYADVKRALHGLKEVTEHWENEWEPTRDLAFQKYRHSKNEGLAECLDFLTDKTGKNYYEDLKNQSLKCNSIAEVNKGKYFTDYSIELEDPKKNNFQYRIRTEKTKAEIKQDWTKDLTGEDWLNQDIKADLLKEKPHYNLNNPIEDKPENTQPFNEFTQDRPATQPEM